MHHFQGISVDTGVSIDGDCSIAHAVNADSIDITFGSSSGSLLLTMTENAAVKLMDLVATALGDLQQRRATAEQPTRMDDRT